MMAHPLQLLDKNPHWGSKFSSGKNRTPASWWGRSSPLCVQRAGVILPPLSATAIDLPLPGS
jgi:hypothetical protein